MIKFLNNIVINKNAEPRHVGGLALVFILLLTIVNLVQATFSELLPDEAYYYMYSTRLAFGYFDHPPIIALLIKIGAFFSHSELGVRIVNVMFSSATFIVLYKICKPQNVLFFILSYLNFIAFQALGFLAVPDVPLLFFTACFFYCYQKFLISENILNATLVAVCAAALIYSKYHGFLVIGFVVLSNLKLLLKPLFYFTILLTLMLILPHILWQINNDFPSIKYHLGYRFDGGVKAENILGYLAGQFAFIGPVAIWALLKCNYKIQKNEPFSNSLIFVALGFLFFFFASSFNGRIEANWTAAAFIPFTILVNQSWQNINIKILKIGALAIIVLMFPIRLYLIYDFLPAQFNYKYQKHGWQQWANNVKQKANGAVLVFQDSYQKTAMYSFYANEFAHSVNSFGCRKSQYDLWFDNEYKIQSKKALVIPNWINNNFDSIPSPLEKKMCCILVYDYHSYTKLNFETAQKSYIIKSTDTLAIDLFVTGPNYVYNTLDTNKNQLCYLSYRVMFTNKDSMYDHITTTLLKPYLSKNKVYKSYLFSNANFEKGKYKIIFYGRVGTTESGYCAPIDVDVQ